MAPTNIPANVSKPKVQLEEKVTAPAETAPAPAPPAAPATETPVDTDNLDTIFNALKTLMTSVDKLQKSRQEVGDIKPLIVRMLDGELLSGDELEQLKIGVSGLSKLVRIYSDYQAALENAQPARDILDTVLK
ncbi:hypothetical protein [Leptothoe sp. PORK10 BA2]|uniref:hypothetical protein n=1 Tax=Leptothoe sp. PORK10 BA2 TaxID=3110254 RepID=UPI002B2015AA|nr:hypothetical protein [Leptothoe sp. PORK10 BA2]MEA5465732.1 hypothetical protein [Leptothoe sp. PORK10 BA2]